MHLKVIIKWTCTLSLSEKRGMDETVVACIYSWLAVWLFSRYWVSTMKSWRRVLSTTAWVCAKQRAAQLHIGATLSLNNTHLHICPCHHQSKVRTSLGWNGLHPHRMLHTTSKLCTCSSEQSRSQTWKGWEMRACTILLKGVVTPICAVLKAVTKVTICDCPHC